MLYKIVETETHGKAVIATEHLKPGPFGFEVFRAEALLLLPPRGSEIDKSGPVPIILSKFDPQIWTDYWIYRQQPESIKRRVLKMYADMDCAHSVWLQEYLIQQQEHKQEEKIGDEYEYDGSILNYKEEFVKFCMVTRYNAVELQPPSDDGTGPGIDYGSGLFEVACTINHSCLPNCVWHTSQDGKFKIVRAIKTIQAGEELTLDYVDCKLDPIHVRREELLKSKGFVCDCSRCAAEEGDDTRRFKCIDSTTSGCSGVHFLNQPLASSEPELFDCTCCGKSASRAYLNKILDIESRLGEEISELDEIGDVIESDVADRIKNLEPPHDLHRLAEKSYRIQGELYSKQGEFQSAAKCYAKQVACRIAILGDDYYNETTAFFHEKLGDILTHVNLDQAEEAYKRSVRTLQLMRGGSSDPYSKCAINKLLGVQITRAVHPSHSLPFQQCEVCEIPPDPTEPPTYAREDLCALCDNASQIKSTCCNRVSYCCSDHLEAHWSLVHTKECPCNRSVSPLHPGALMPISLSDP
jgi:hypothetical protein